jgi:Zierdtviridae DNA helicase
MNIISAEIIRIGKGDRISVVNIPWDNGRGRDRAKKIPGARSHYEDGKFKFWHYPVAMSTARGLRKEFGDDLQLGPKLTAWGWDEHRRTEELEALRAGTESDLPLVRTQAPGLWEALEARPFQIAGTAFLAKSHMAVLGDAPRLGKTYQALAAVVETGAKRILIACPKTATRTVWYRKILELTPTIWPFVAQGTRAQRQLIMKEFNDSQGSPKALIINLEMIRVVRKWQCPEGTEWKIAPGRKGGCRYNHEHKTVFHPEYSELFDKPWDAIILDECHHALASRFNKQSANITQIRLGAVRLPVTDPPALLLGMSGTPFRSNLQKSWGVFNWLRPDVFSSFWQYAERHLGVSEGEYSMEVGKKILDMDAWLDEVRPYYLARTKAEVAPWLPPIDYAGEYPKNNPEGGKGVYLEMEGQQAKAYQHMKDMASAVLEDGTINANGVLAEITRLRQLANSWGRMTNDGTFYPAAPSNKLEWILEFLDERKDNPGKVVIVSQFTKMVKFVADEIRKAGWAVVTLTGEDNDRQREHMQDLFMSDKPNSPRVAVINVFAGGEAIDLSSADEMVFIDEPWTADAITQAENRIQNLAKRQQLTIYRLRSAGTIDEWIAEMTQEQRELLLTARPTAQNLRAALTKSS